MRGLTYDTGFSSRPGVSTWPGFAAEQVVRDMAAIREELHADAVRITGGDPERLEIAARAAAAAGLAVWFSPFTCDLTTRQLLELLADCAERAERLRADGADVVFLTGSELSLFTIGLLPGDTLSERVSLLSDPPLLRTHLPALGARVNALLAEAVALVRARFGGPVGYASLPFEGVDWTPFDVVASDAGYRDATTAAGFGEQIRAFVEQGRALGKPVAITEFGCTTYRGAADRGGRGDALVDWAEDGTALGLTGDPVRDEGEQARYLIEVLDVLDAEGVDAAFVNTFARRDLPHDERDLDRASFGIVRVLPGGWEPKAAYDALAARLAGRLVTGERGGPGDHR